jgi:hypothetical protein
MPSAPDTDDVIMKPDAKMQGRRHRMINLLSLLLTGLRAFEIDLRALENLNPQINELTNEYIPLLVDTVREAAVLVKTSTAGPVVE